MVINMNKIFENNTYEKLQKKLKKLKNKKRKEIENSDLIKKVTEIVGQKGEEKENGLKYTDRKLKIRHQGKNSVGTTLKVEFEDEVVFNCDLGRKVDISIYKPGEWINIIDETYKKLPEWSKEKKENIEKQMKNWGIKNNGLREVKLD